MEKERLDVLLVKKGLAASRELAKAFVMEGRVYIGDMKEDKPGRLISADTHITLRGGEPKYVSRGGLKLEKAIGCFGIDLSGKTCMDVGASTGGFTDCMLQNGAAKVYSVDVGYGQFAWKLRNDSRVVVLEKTNIRYLENLGEKLDFASIDVSFISLRLVLPPTAALLKENGEIVALIKPQFEAGRGQVGKKGVVRDKSVHLEVMDRVIGYAIDEGLNIADIDFSPVKGPEGNIEYLIYLKKNAEGLSRDEAGERGREAVRKAHELL